MFKQKKIARSALGALVGALGLAGAGGAWAQSGPDCGLNTGKPAPASPFPSAPWSARPAPTTSAPRARRRPRTSSA
jgi:hypothetical protein